MYESDIVRLLTLLEDCSRDYPTMLGGMAGQNPKVYGILALERRGFVVKSNEDEPRRGCYILTEEGKEYHKVIRAYVNL